MYNSTPHSVTGKSPSELFFKRKNRDKIPMLQDIDKEEDSEDKLASTFKPTPHVVEKTTCGDVTVTNEETGQILRRNLIHLKRVEGEWKSIQDDNLNEDTTNINE
ncbi:unnamed protein product [Euphydryas editha]|uniref:Uncharacterized protein n=1 Tax=Euphydryas editha TaxID=104508 RepID=A0AAU9TRZ6_EUPED|nr:unnamed protein product [Euphydryas editha]